MPDLHNRMIVVQLLAATAQSLNAYTGLELLDPAQHNLSLAGAQLVFALLCQIEQGAPAVSGLVHPRVYVVPNPAAASTVLALKAMFDWSRGLIAPAQGAPAAGQPRLPQQPVPSTSVSEDEQFLLMALKGGTDFTLADRSRIGGGFGMEASAKYFQFMFFDTTRMSTDELVKNLGTFAANWTKVYRRQPYETINAHTDKLAALQQDVIMIDTFPDLNENTYQLLRLFKPVSPFTALTAKITAALKTVHESDKAQEKLTAKRKRGTVAYGDDLPEDISDGIAEATGQAFKRLADRLDSLIPQGLG